MKKVLSGALAALCITGTTEAHGDLARLFAGCAGRFSAELEHAWLMNQDKSADLAMQRQDMLVLLDATMDRSDARALLAYRIEAKLAQAALLTLSDFSVDEARARDARRLAERHRTTCHRLLLGA